MVKYSLETKLTAIDAYINGIESLKTVAEKYNVHRVMLQKWIAKFREHGLDGLQKTYTNYSVEFKMDVLNYMNETGASILETTTVFNLPASSTV